MQRDIWKWIFQEMPEEDLYEIVQHCKITIKGFRKIELAMIKNVRTKCVKELLQPQMLMQAKQFLQSKSSETLSKSKEELIEACIDQVQAANILSVLSSSTNEEHILIADEIYKKIEKDMQTVTNEDRNRSRVHHMQILIEQFEEKIKKQEIKYNEMVDQLASKSQYILQKDQVVKKYERDVKKYKQIIEEMENRSNEFEYELTLQQRIIASLQEEIEKKGQEHEHYCSIIRQCEEEIHRLQMGVANEIAADQQAALQPYIVVGDVQKKKLSGHPFLLLDQVKDFDTHAFEDYEFVCVLRFSLPPSVLRNVKKSLRPEQLKEFYTLEQFIQWERMR